MASSARYIPNPYTEYRAKEKPYSRSSECKEILGRARQWLKENIIKFQSEYPPETTITPSNNPRKKSRDPSIYTGAGGNAYVHWKLTQFYKMDGNEDRATEHLMKGLEAIHTALLLKDGDDGRGVAFYIGAPGLYTLALLLYIEYKEPIKIETYLEHLLSCLPQVLLTDTPDELLFGRAGYLSCLLIVKKYLSKDVCRKAKVDDVLKKVFSVLVQSGQKEQDHLPVSQRYLHYYFYGSDYLGAAHGTAGILYMLLQCPSEWCKDPDIQPWLLNTLEHLMSTQLPNGNFPSKDSGRREGKVVHWCHGSPGVVPVLYQAYKVFGDVRYLSSMERGLKSIWQYGILKKGIGLCHGITGNAYTFLSLYRLTSDDQYYYQCIQMAQCMWNEPILQAIANYSDPQRFKQGEPDRFLSLMEGLGGSICFFCILTVPHSLAMGRQLRL